ncbi:MAG TPA: hypothetical protein VHZ31_04115 [Solirubrobacteraceae bacterium]|nr:hypothetical protein [Solirubrobacteraceae bacterium]
MRQIAGIVTLAATALLLAGGACASAAAVGVAGVPSPAVRVAGVAAPAVRVAGVPAPAVRVAGVPASAVRVGGVPAAAVRVVDVPGVAGRSVRIAAAGRLADGGAIVAGTVAPVRRGARPRLVVVRLRHDGIVDEAFGDEGVVTAQLARGGGRGGSHATAVAVDPASGRSWIGAAVGRTAAGAVLALDGHGRRVRGFGTNAVVRLHGDASAPTAVAYGGGRLAVAATQQPCGGCQLLLLDARSGARGPSAALAPVAGGDAGGCPRAQLTSLAFVGGGRLVLGGSGGSCPTRVVVRDGTLGAVGVWGVGAEAQRTVVAAAGAPLDLCTSIERAGAVTVVRANAGAAAPGFTLPSPGWPAIPGAIGGIVPLGDGACGALVLHGGGAAQVLQASDGDARPAVVALPAGLRAGAIYRCERDVLVVGTRRSGGVDRAAVAVTPIARR